jgi:hypothetical protein
MLNASYSPLAFSYADRQAIRSRRPHRSLVIAYVGPCLRPRDHCEELKINVTSSSELPFIRCLLCRALLCALCFISCLCLSHSSVVLLAGLPYVRPMPPIPAVAGQQLVVKCPVAGYPIDTIIWEKGKSQYY